MTDELPGADPGRRSRLAAMPRVVTGLVAIIVAAHVLRTFLPWPAQLWVFDTFEVKPSALLSGDPLEWLRRGLGHMFVHGAPTPPIGQGFLGSVGFGLMHVFFNSALILQTGEVVARRFEAGKGATLRFLALFFLSGLAGAAAYALINAQADVGAVGASGAACGLFAAYLLAAHPDWRVSIRHPGVLRAGFWFVALNVGVAAAARSGGVLPIAWEAHAGGIAAGFLLYPLLAPKWRPGPWDA